jgi:hypothetical protein
MRVAPRADTIEKKQLKSVRKMRNQIMTSVVDEFSHVIKDHEKTSYSPFVYPEAGRSGGTSEFGEIAVLRETSYNGNRLVVGFWRVQPSTSPLYDIPLGDESGYVIE